MKKFLASMFVIGFSVLGITTGAVSSSSLTAGVENVKTEVVAMISTPEAGAFLSSVADDIGTAAEAEVGVLLAGPVGGIIVFVLGLAVIGFVVAVIMGWLGRRKRG